MSFFYDKNGYWREWATPVLVIVIWVVIFLLVWGFVALISNTQLPLKEKRANFEAQCRSVGGEMGETVCYKDGIVVYTLEK